MISDDGGIEARKGFEVPLTLYGIGLRNDSEIIFTSAQGEFGDNCQSGEVHVKTSSYNLVANDEGTVATLTIPAGDLPAIKGQEQFYVCLKSKDDVMSMHQGSDGEGLKIKVYVLILPVWLMVIFIVILLCLSGLFSGLNLGLMALDQTELKIVQNTGTDKEKDYANKIFPIRSHGNFLLCSLLLGNVLVNNTLTILLDTLTSGLVAVIGATMGIVVFGEIIPQAICSRHGLAVGAYTIWLTKIFMVLTFPLSYPISKLLDCILGAEIGTVYDKKKLIELLRVTNDDNDLEKEEVDIVTGALVYKEKTVLSVMTKLDDCYMLPMRSSLNFATVSEIREQGYSRIPVYDGDRANIVHVLFAKDLMFIDPDDNMPLAMVCEFYNNDVNFVFHDTPLNVMFNEFKSGEKGHMAFVQDVNTSGEGDPFYETIGLVTLEDIIEEIIQQEIVDETDVITDNKTKKKRRREKFKGGVDGTAFHQMFGEPTRKVTIGPQLTLAVFQYLTTSIEPFKSCYISDAVLKRLLTMDVYREIKIKTENQRKISSDKEDEEDLIIMHKGKSIDYFILIIEGKVEVNIGREELIFESGPFTYFGIQTLNQVIQSPSSPILAYKAAQAVAAGAAAGGGGVNPAGTPPSVMSSHDLVGSNSKQSNLRKASTQHSIDIPANMNMNKRNSQDAGSSRMSVTPMYAPFIPDYTIKAVTDVLYLKLKRNTYLRAIKASLMGKKQSHSGELNEKELDRFLAKVNEDEGGDHEMSMMLRTPVLTSPNKSEQSLDQDHKLHKINPSSGTSTPTMAAKGEVMRGQVSGSHMNNNRNIGRGKEEHGGAEAWDKDSVANALKQKKVGGGSSATASTTEIVSLAAEKAAASVEKAAAGADQGEDEFWDKDTLAVARDKAKTAASAGASKLESEAANVLNKMEAVGNDLKSNGGSALMSSVRDRDPDAAEGGDSETALKDKSIGKAS